MGISCLRLTDRRVSEEDTTIQVAVTICTAYISFFVGQYIVGVSGVICCCFAGLCFAWLGPPLILQPATMEAIFHALEWMGNTLIFTIAGLLVGHQSIRYITISDFGSIFITYFTMQAIRAALLVICHPIISSLSSVYTVKEAVFTGFSGIRGAISLALVLELSDHAEGYSDDNNDFLFPARHVHTAMFVICGSVTLSVAINGSLSDMALKRLGITRSTMTLDDQIILHYVIKRIQLASIRMKHMLEKSIPNHDDAVVISLCSILEGMKPRSDSSHVTFADMPEYVEDDSHLDGLDISDLKESSPSDVDIYSLSPASPLGDEEAPVVEMEGALINDDESDRIHLRRMFRNLNLTSYKVTYRNLDSEINPDLIIKMRNVFLEVLRKSYRKQIASGRIPRGSKAARILFNSIDIGLETVHTPGLQDWLGIEAALREDDTWYGGCLPESVRENAVAETVICLSSFIAAHEYAQAKIPQYLGEKEFIDTPEEALVVRESKNNVREASRVLSSIDKVIYEIELSKLVARMILHHQEDTIIHFVEEGILPPKDAERLLLAANMDLKKVKSFTHHDK